MTKEEAKMIEFMNPGWRLPALAEVANSSLQLTQCWYQNDPYTGKAFLMLVREIK